MPHYLFMSGGICHHGFAGQRGSRLLQAAAVYWDEKALRGENSCRQTCRRQTAAAPDAGCHCCCEDIGSRWFWTIRATESKVLSARCAGVTDVTKPDVNLPGKLYWPHRASYFRLPGCHYLHPVTITVMCLFQFFPPLFWYCSLHFTLLTINSPIYLCLYLTHSLSQLVSQILFYLWAVRSLIKAVSQLGGDTAERDSVGYGWKATKACNHSSFIARLAEACSVCSCWCVPRFLYLFFLSSLSWVILAWPLSTLLPCWCFVLPLALMGAHFEFPC